MSVASACEAAQGVVKDHNLPHAAIEAFGSLGGHGKSPQNSERDLHRWLRSIYGFELQPYVLHLGLQIDSVKVRKVPVRVLAPHEILHSIAVMHADSAFDSLMLGNLEDGDRRRFWRHVQSLPAWKTHPIFQQPVDLSRIIGLTIHGDGAVMKRDDESFVWSISSCFSTEGIIKDPLLLKFPVAMIPERYMLSHDATCIERLEDFESPGPQLASGFFFAC